MSATDIGAVLDRLKDFVFSDNDIWAGMQVRCAHCEVQVYDVEDGDWLECIISNAFAHVCKAG
ncbi:hypothetical protein [Nonomuraea candida]|uniref:hypothetical protein n=1 Tax=Nonomuraea candida TaxID=359159 RepID=UPI0005BC2E58|nr:hypothetical protein [Nonomuraea candida]